VKLTRATDIGLGLPMYFIFVKTMGVVLFLCALLSLPSLIFSIFGHRILTEDRDFLSLYRFTIGNIGYNPDSNTYATDSLCTGVKDLTCTRLFDQEFSLQAIANIISMFEIAQILIFLLGYLVLRSACSSVRGGVGSRSCSISDYSIRVDNIPPNTTISELMNHFSGLYQLNQPDWKNRKPLSGAQPIQDVRYNGDALYIGKWVAEVSIYSRIGSLITAFKRKKILLETLLRCRARMKMYKDDTPHASGPNPSKFRCDSIDDTFVCISIDVCMRVCVYLCEVLLILNIENISIKEGYMFVTPLLLCLL
jgi:hypothetical protein